MPTQNRGREVSDRASSLLFFQGGDTRIQMHDLLRERNYLFGEAAITLCTIRHRPTRRERARCARQHGNGPLRDLAVPIAFCG
jgi:hypothetical protein